MAVLVDSGVTARQITDELLPVALICNLSEPGLRSLQINNNQYLGELFRVPLLICCCGLDYLQ
jgi:hypothetical protein